MIDQATNSARAREILSDWVTEKVKFVRVMPRDYKNALRLLENEKTDQSSGLESEKALLQHDAADGQVRTHQILSPCSSLCFWVRIYNRPNERVVF